MILLSPVLLGEHPGRRVRALVFQPGLVRAGLPVEVVGVDVGTEDDDAVWRALSHPVRRRLLDLLRDGARTSGELVERVTPEEGLGRHAVLQHLGVLRAAGLVLVERRGRHRLNHLNAVPIQRIHDRWVSRYQEPWIEALVGLKAAVEASATHERHTGPRAREDGVG